jgi:hypothetical protein
MKKHIITALLLNTILSTSLVAQSVQPISIKQDITFCTTNTSSVFCNRSEEPLPLPAGNTDLFIKQLILANRTIKDRFFMVRDVADVWTSFGEGFIQNRSYSMKGDCEDLAMTTIEYAIHLGIPKNRLARAIVISYPLSSEGNFERTEIHMVAVYYSVETNKFYYFGDTLANGIVMTTASHHEPIFIDWLADKYGWITVETKELQILDQNNK